MPSSLPCTLHIALSFCDASHSTPAYRSFGAPPHAPEQPNHVYTFFATKTRPKKKIRASTFTHLTTHSSRASHWSYTRILRDFTTFIARKRLSDPERSKLVLDRLSLPIYVHHNPCNMLSPPPTNTGFGIPSFREHHEGWHRGIGSHSMEFSRNEQSATISPLKRHPLPRSDHDHSFCFDHRAFLPIPPVTPPLQVL